MTIIDMSDAPAALLFADSCGVTVEQLRSAVDAVGPLAFDVRNHLQNVALYEYRAKISGTAKPLPPPTQSSQASQFVWKNTDSAPQGGERVIVFVSVQPGEPFIAIGSFIHGVWRLEIDQEKYRDAVVAPSLWTELPQTMPLAVKRE